MFSNLDHKISILIKTFNRKSSLVRLLRSLEKLQCTLPILIADDSRQPYADKILSAFPSLKIQYYNLSFDSGLSAGRNYLLQKTTTPFFLLCDDDFVFDKKIDITKALSIVEENNLDIGGGTFLNFITINNFRRLVRILITPHLLYRFIRKQPSYSSYIGNFTVANQCCILYISNTFTSGKELCVCDVVNNFFIGKTESIKRMNGWDAALKVGEHEDFFFRAKLAGLKTAMLEAFFIKHYPMATTSYLRFRERSHTMKLKFAEKFGFSTYKEIDTDTGKIVFESHSHQTAIKTEC
jgi:glycosyltransferase involved in cell wall biosynthesis